MAAAADDNDDCTDCDVIFENSPLYWSMVDAGLEDIGEQDVHKVKHVTSDERGLKATDHGKFQWGKIGERCIQQLTTLFSLKDGNKTLIKEVYGQAFGTLANSSLLTHEDDLFLQDLGTEGQHDTTHSASHTAYSRKWLAGACSVVTVLLGIFSPWHHLHPWGGVVVAGALFILLLPMLLAPALRDWRRRSVRRKGEALLASVGRVMNMASKWSDVAAKSVRFIQESELVARGFTFVGKSASGGVVKELQPSHTQQRQCPLLRRALFLASRSVFSACRCSFAHLLHLCPVKVEVSGVTRYCSEIPLSQYPSMLQHDLDGRSEEAAMAALHDMTDGFSIDVLKVKDVLCITLSSLLDATTSDLERLHSDLQSCLTAHRHGSVKATSSKKSRNNSATWQPPSSASQLQLTHAAVHSLELHLLAALKKIQVLSEVLEKNLEEDQNQNSTTAGGSVAPKAVEDPLRDDWRQMLMAVRSELGACSGCVDEGVKQLERKDLPDSRVTPEVTGTPSVPAPTSSVSVITVSAQNTPVILDEETGTLPVSDPSPSVSVITVSAQNTPVILDEVYEAYSEPPDYDSGRGPYDLRASEEEAWQKQQQGNVKLCLRELQTIIDVRAAHREERERAAMDRMKQITASEQRELPSSNIHPHRLQVENPATGSAPEEDPKTSTAENVDDLAEDVAERVEFWKQFNQTMTTETENTDSKQEEFGKRLAQSMTKETVDNGTKEGLEFVEKFDNKETTGAGSGTKYSSVKEGLKFVKEFDDKEITGAGNKTKYTPSQGEEGSIVGEEENTDESCGKWLEEKESYQIVETISGSSSQDSDFVVVDDQGMDSEVIMTKGLNLQAAESKPRSPNNPQNLLCSTSSPAVKNSIGHSSHSLHTFKQSDVCGKDHDPGDMTDEEETKDIINSDPADISDSNKKETEGSISLLGPGRKPLSSFQNLPKPISSEDRTFLERAEETGDERSAEDDIDALQPGRKSSSFQNPPISSEDRTVSGRADESDGEVRERTRPEGVEEHLSLAAAPSPLAFSIASMVASRARHLAQVEERFGDSSSEEEEEGEEEGG
ncbi:hypothetical protein ACOMHN_049341 [Nucella lapillus]